MSEPRDLLKELERLERGQAQEPVTTSQRRCDRYVVRADAQLLHMDRSADGTKPMSVLVRDVSRGGLGFVSSQPLEPESVWHVVFLRHGFVVGQQSVVIRHCRSIGDGAYLVGGQFCIDSGLMTLLGVHASQLQGKELSQSPADSDHDFNDQFVSPQDLMSDEREAT